MLYRVRILTSSKIVGCSDLNELIFFLGNGCYNIFLGTSKDVVLYAVVFN